jgi:hypothetical protein
MGDFYSTSAQVLPTLLIALVIEFSYLADFARRRQLRFSGNRFLYRFIFGMSRKTLADASANASKEEAFWRKRFWNLGTTFLIGELLSFGMLMFKAPEWLSRIVGLVVFLCIVRLASAVTYIPAARFLFAGLDQTLPGKPRDRSK